jgi:hypothetical protein
VPTVDRGLEPTVFWSMDTTGDRPVRGAFDGPVDDVLFPHLAPADDLGVGHAVGGPQDFLGRQVEVALDVQALPRVAVGVDGPC